MRKIRKYPIHDEAHVRNALSRLGQEAPKATLKKLGVSIDSVLKKVLKRAKSLKMYSLLMRNEDTCNRLGISVPKVKASEEVEAEKDVLKNGIRKTVDLLKVSRKGLESATKNVTDLRKRLADTLKELRKAKKETLFNKR